MVTLVDRGNAQTRFVLALMVFGVGIGCGDESATAASQLDAEVMALDGSISADQTTAGDEGTTEGTVDILLLSNSSTNP